MQRVKSELRNIDPSVKVITRSGMVTWGSKEEAARDPLTYHEGSNLKKGQETMVVADQDLAQKVAAIAQVPTHPKTDEGVEPFLQECMKLLHNPKAIENFHALMNSYAAQPDLTPGTKYVHKLYRYKKCIRR